MAKNTTLIYNLGYAKTQMKKIFVIIITLMAIVGAFCAGVFYWRFLRGIAPVVKQPPQDITELIDKDKKSVAENKTGMPLKLPEGFSISIFAKNLPGARVMAFDKLGNLWVSQTKEGQISLLEIKDDRVVSQSAPFRNLNNPHGLAFDSQDPFLLYFAEENRITKTRVYSEDRGEKIADLPSDGGHFTRTISFGPDGRLYVSIGSSCNVCDEKDGRRAKIFSMEKDGSDFKEFASGLRNAVFFTWSYVDGRMWATEMGRDWLGDDLPPDEINIIKEGKNYGWPYFYGKNIKDAKSGLPEPPVEWFVEPSYIDVPAHSSPLGLAFITGSGWPKDFQNNLLVAYHGSWNRSEPTGYKIVRYKLDEKGNYLGSEDFISGWLTKDGALGRPVDVLVRPEGVLYIPDDKAGVIYKVEYKDDEV